MAQHVRRRSRGRKPKGGDTAAEFFAALPDDQNWMSSLRDELEGDPSGDGDGVRAIAGKAVSLEEWTAVQDLLEEQGSALLAMAARVDDLEQSLAEVADRVAPVVDPRPPPPTARDVVRTLQQHAAGIADRLRTRP